ncbi:MAG: hypothetical protein KIT58_19155 [Planctomycetota bacterium]|nr:hypothetical protein [Planctomycetota bacterium]
MLPNVLTPRSTSLRCALCHAGLGADEAVACPACRTLLHGGCWPLVRGCPTLGCARRSADGGPGRGAAAAKVRRGRRPTTSLLVAVLLGLLAMVAAALQPPRRDPPSWAMSRLCDAIEANVVGIEALPRLLALVPGEPLAGRWRAKAVVVHRFGGELVSPLREALGSPATEQTARWWILRTLQDLGPSAAAALPEVVQALDDPDDRVCSEAIVALECISPVEQRLPADAILRLVLMSSGDRWVDGQAAHLLERRAKDDIEVRRALIALWHRRLRGLPSDGGAPGHRQSAEEGLRRALQDPDPELRVRAERILRQERSYNTDPRLDPVSGESR